MGSEIIGGIKECLEKFLRGLEWSVPSTLAERSSKMRLSMEKLLGTLFLLKDVGNKQFYIEAKKCSLSLGLYSPQL